MVNLSIDQGLIENCKEKGLNLSEMCENYLKEILLTFEQTIDPSQCIHKWTFPFTTTFGLAKECLKCRTIERVYVDSVEGVWEKP